MSPIKTQVTKAVLPVAGLGTRMLPATKATPKEMLPIVDKPLVQLVVEEAIQAGIKEIVLVTHVGKESISHHFERNVELETILDKTGKSELLAEIQHICPPDVSIIQVHQKEQRGLGHAILCARPVVGEHPFVVLLPDVLISCADAQVNLPDMIARFAETQTSQVMVEPVPYEKVHLYGIVRTDTQHLNRIKCSHITDIIEKPKRHEAPSNLAIVGRYVFCAKIWDVLAKTQPDKSGEIQLTQAIHTLMQDENVDAYLMHGKSYDCGSKLGYCIAFLEYAMQDPKIGPALHQQLKQAP